MKSLIHFTVGLLLFVSLATFASEAERPLVLVMGEDSFPYQFVDDNGDVKGILVDLWREWSSQTQTPVVFVPRHWSASLTQLKQARADVHIGMGWTAERQHAFDFAEPFSSVSTYLYLRKTLVDKNSFKDLRPYRIGVVTGSSHESILSAQASGLNFRYYASRVSLLKGVIDGEVDVFAGMEGYLRDTSVSRAVMEQFPIQNRLLINKTQMLPAVVKGNQALIAKINQGFKHIPIATRDKIEKRWLGYSNDANTLVIATSIGIQPFVDLGGDGEPHGLYVDIWKLWSKKTGINVVFRPATMSETLEDIKYRRADIQIGYPESETMKTRYSRAWQIYQLKSRLFSYREPIKNITDLVGKRIGVVPTAPYLDKLKAELPESELKIYPDVQQMIEAAKAGHITAFFASSAWTQHYLLTSESWSDFYQFPDLTFITNIYGLVRNEDKGLVKRIQAGFKLISQEELASIEAKWVLNSDDRTFSINQTQLHFDAQQTAYLESLPPLKVGYLRHWEPMEFQGADGQFNGINSEVSYLLANKLHLELQPVVFDEWNALLEALKIGDIDIAGSVAQTASREKDLVFSSAYWPSPWGLITAHDQIAIFNLSQLSGKRLAIVAGYHLIPNLMNNIKSLELVLVPNTRAGIDAVAQGNADAFIEKVVNMGGELRASDYRNLKMSVLADYASEQSHFGLNPKLKPLLPMLDKAIAQISSEQQQQIYQRWSKHNNGTMWYHISWKQGFVLLFIFAIIALVLVSRRVNKNTKAELTRVKNQLTSLEKFDSQTGLANRSLLDDRLQQAVLMHRREMIPFAVLFICFDNIRDVNQGVGHEIGNKAFLLGAKELQEAVRKSDTLARFGENEFIMVLNRIQDLDKVCQVADSIVGRFSRAFAIDGIDVALSVSIGVAMYPSDGDSAVELLKTADQLMSRAVQHGGQCYRCA
ncbi:transporter substrate-binding domain-containing protein [Shewanella sp. Isolate11]|uniref:transporter substrate-binding domain-containing protein n=1 Tax=Shewanella sp. Isolate11 TaxID=2908530 RepID=UPI001EFD24F5|nr:transporter substrate-binding domain-containing protein [Shewanella sp. Isolate11]MCG9696566.1 transporter substrate-binding domain-containing protein [Shewanella sp. Isolate11]